MAAKHRDPRAACWQIALRFGNLLCHRAAWQFGGWLLNKCGRCRIWNFKKNKQEELWAEMQVAREITLSTSVMVICQDAYSHQHCTMTDVIKKLQMRKRKKNPSESQISLSKMSEHRANGRQPRSLRVAEGEVGRGREIGEVLCWAARRRAFTRRWVTCWKELPPDFRPEPRSNRMDIISKETFPSFCRLRQTRLGSEAASKEMGDLDVAQTDLAL